jgi:hypothetical protein
MAYTLTNSQGKTVAVIQDGSIDKTSTSINLPGRNYAGYGQALNEDLIYLLENFAAVTSPNKPLTGQLWFDTSVKKIKIYNGTSFKSVSNLEYTNITPTNQTQGDLWLNTNTNQLFFYDGVKYNLVGPLETGQKTNQTLSQILFDVAGNAQTVTQYIVNGIVISMFSTTEFNLDSTKTPVTGWENNARIYKGINLPSQQTYPNVQFAGVAQTAATVLVNNQQIPASSLLLNTGTQQTITTSLKVGVSPTGSSLAGLYIGSNSDMLLSSVSGLAAISNINSNIIQFNLKPSAAQTTVGAIQITDTGIYPVTSDGYNIGTLTNRFNMITANNFYAIDDPNLQSGNGSFNGKVVGTSVSATQGFTGNLIGSVLNGSTKVVDNTASTAVFTGNLVGNVTGILRGNMISTTTQNTVVDTSGSTAIFNGNLNGVAASSNALVFNSRNYSTLDSTQTSSAYNYTVPVRDGNGNIYANNFKGTADIAVQIYDATNNVGRSAETGTYSSGGSSSDPNTVVVRDGSSSINVTLVRGTAWNAQAVNGAVPFIQNTTSATGYPGGSVTGTLVQRDPTSGNIYVGDVHCGQVVTGGGDLAEWYKSDDPTYDQGTVVMLGGNSEITIATDPTQAFGIVSASPGVLINDGDATSWNACAIALVGRVGVKVKGVIKKGQRIMLSDEPGVATLWDGKDVITILGRAVCDNDDPGIKVTECSVLVR